MIFEIIRIRTLTMTLFIISIFVLITCSTICLINAERFNLKRRVIIDVDAGVDDYQALAILLLADTYKHLKIEAITCTDANTDLRNVERNVIRILEIVGRTDIPVYGGSFQSLLNNNITERFYGDNGFGDIQFNKEPNLGLIKEIISPTFINNLVSKEPGQITIITLGALTNIALALRMYPDVKNNIKDMFIMGGNYETRKKEFNFRFDPEAAHIVLENAKFPITLLTWQGCISQIMSMDWRFSITMSNPVWNIMEKAERKLFGDRPPNDNYVSCDPILAAIVIDESLITESVMVNAFVELHDLEYRAEVFTNKITDPTVRIVTNFDKTRYQQLWINTFNTICNFHSCNDCYE